ncbi:YgiT-type zinc finger protein [Streptomyces sp. NPDC059786]|uniref:YgiT-type zinc finger protein n=1 Tax=Streptomyces sp. NPDC059786 TaxID=3346946 RepID=UPI003662D21E
MTACRRARYRSIYVNGIPVWECGRCGDRQPAATPHATLARHENECGQERP